MGRDWQAAAARAARREEREYRKRVERELRRGTFNSTSFKDKPQRSDPTVTNTFFNSGAQDGGSHGHVQYRDNPDGTTDYLFARDVEGNVYDV